MGILGDDNCQKAETRSTIHTPGRLEECGGCPLSQKKTKQLALGADFYKRREDGKAPFKSGILQPFYGMEALSEGR